MHKPAAKVSPTESEQFILAPTGAIPSVLVYTVPVSLVSIRFVDSSHAIDRHMILGYITALAQTWIMFVHSKRPMPRILTRAIYPFY